MKKNENTSKKSDKVPAFVSRAERAFRRAAKNVRAQHRAMKLPLIVWEDGKVVRQPA